MVVKWNESISNELKEIETTLAEAVKSDSSELEEICTHVVCAGGKRIRPALCILSYYVAGGKDVSKSIDVGSAFEIVHSATLIHDDINDCSEIRRGRKALHKEYTVSKAILAGDYLLVKGFYLLGSYSEEIVRLIVETAGGMTSSELLQKGFEGNVCVTEEDYYKIIKGKTALLISAAAVAGASIVKPGKEIMDKIKNYAVNIGMAFQIIDDVLDVTGDDGILGKKTGSDLIENKPTLPIIFGMQDKTHGKRISELFMKKTISKKEVEEGIGLIKKTEAIERCRKKAEEFANAAKKSLDGIQDSKYKESLIALADFIVVRDR